MPGGALTLLWEENSGAADCGRTMAEPAVRLLKSLRLWLKLCLNRSPTRCCNDGDEEEEDNTLVLLGSESNVSDVE